jgi:hypothetical protein
MSLPTPIEVFEEVKRVAKEVFFAFMLILVVLPLVHWGFIVLACVAILLGHKIIAFCLFAPGLLGLLLNKTIKI